MIDIQYDRKCISTDKTGYTHAIAKYFNRLKHGMISVNIQFVELIEQNPRYWPGFRPCPISEPILVRSDFLTKGELTKYLKVT